MTDVMTIPEKIASDPRLTRQEKGLLVEMLGRQNHRWTRQELESKGQGRIPTLRMLQKLARCGYVRKEHVREDGKPFVFYQPLPPR
jgi:type II secretory pathway component PulJ